MERGVVRHGLVVRSDAPVRLGEEGRAALRSLGIRRAVDLREPVERELDPVDFAGLGIEVVHQPILGGDFDVRTEMTLEAIYLTLLERPGEGLTAAVGALADPEKRPVLYFCSAGKDRTGLVSALLLGALGAREDVILTDYNRTEQNLSGPFRASLRARAIAAGISEQEMSVKIGAPTALMASVLAWLRSNHGGAVGYLRGHGLTTGELEDLRRGLIRPLASAA